MYRLALPVSLAAPIALAVGLTACVEPAGSAATSGLPTTIGQCSQTRVKEIGNRLIGSSGSGSSVSFENGGYQVDYEQVYAVDSSRPGDPVRMCLVSVPQDCPPGDDRSRVYTTTNLRTGYAWSLPDASHLCGGA